jgi:hypothetical protein
MLRSAKSLFGYKILAVDDLIGQVHDFYFDDQTWTVRYLVVDTGNWLPGRKVLVAPVALGQPDWETKVFPVELTREQIENSPEIDVDKPISRQQETDLHDYYGWPTYWGHTPTIDDRAAGQYPTPYLESQKLAEKGIKEEQPEQVADQAIKGEQIGDQHLRSTDVVMGYHIHTTDGELGHVEDFIVGDDTWSLHYMVIDTRNWLPGRQVLVSPQWIERISWADSQVYVDLPRDTIKNSPEYDPSAPVNREYETRLYDYYGRPKYWLES